MQNSSDPDRSETYDELQILFKYKIMDEIFFKYHIEEEHLKHVFY